MSTLNKQAVLRDLYEKMGRYEGEKREGVVAVVGSIESGRFDTSPINALANKAYQNAIDKGWHEDPRSFGDEIALIHSELSEALEDYRNGRGLQEIYFEGEKPCGVPTELADAVIRILHVCGHLGIDLEAAIIQKMAYNSTRPVRHGGKKL